MPRPATGKTPVRNVRIPDHVWKPAQTIAAERGETLTSVIEAALRRYIARHRPAADTDDRAETTNDAHPLTS